MIARLLAALFACGCTLAASEHGAPPAGAAPLDPAPRTSPSAPLPEDESRLDPQKRLQRRLERLLREHEERIRVLTASGVPGTVRDPIGDPTLEEPLRGRDQALRELRKALQAHVERTPAPRRDELDHPSSRALPGSGADPISARNRLAVAECLRDLAAAPEGIPQDVEDGIAALNGLDTARLSETERALGAYLQVWFLAERARRLPADAAPAGGPALRPFAVCDGAPGARGRVVPPPPPPDSARKHAPPLTSPPSSHPPSTGADGTVEGVELHGAASRLVGVMWHPEREAPFDAPTMSLLRGLFGGTR